MIVEQGGGLAGNLNHQIAGPVNTADIDTGDRGRLEALIEEMDCFQMLDDWPDTRRISDAMWHALTCTDGADKVLTVRWTDRQQPPEQLMEAYQLVATLAEWRKPDLEENSPS